MTTTMVKKFVESQSSTNLMVQVEATLIANVSGTMADYTPESFVANVVDTKVHSTGRVLALVAGRYLCDGTGTLPLNAYAPFVVLLSTDKTILASEQPDWANGGGFEIGLSAECQDPAAFGNFNEWAGMTCATPCGSGVGGEFASALEGWIIGGQVYFKSPAGATAPNSATSPIIVAVNGTTQIFTILSSEITGANAPSTWVTTDVGAANNYQPMSLNDIHYDETANAIVAVGGMADNTGLTTSVGMVIEAINENTFTVLNNIAAGFLCTTSGTPNHPCFYRQCTVINSEPSRPVFMLGGTTSNGAIGINEFATGVLSLYTPNWAVPWGGGNPRVARLDRGTVDAQDFFTAGLGIGVAFIPQDINLIERVTLDEEDILFVAGCNANSEPFLWSCAPPTIEDNAIKQIGVPTIVNWDKQQNLSQTKLIPALTAASVTLNSNRTVMSVIGLSARKAKILTGGSMKAGSIMSRDVTNLVPVEDNGGFILNISRGANLWQNDLMTQAPSLTYQSLVATNYRTNSTLSGADLILLNNKPMQGTFFSPISLTSQLVTTGNIAMAYFEYLLYDGVDALVAKKLQQLGIRITITNVEWYKQKILKQSLDLDADFFRDWANLQEQQNAERERLNERYGATRPAKRAVRTELFDEYAHMEELLGEMDKMREMEPDFEVPWSDEVGDAQEARVREKVALDVVTIDELAEKGELDSVEELEDSE